MLFYLFDHPNKLYIHLSQALLFCLICHTPIENRGLSIDSRPFSTSLQLKKKKKTGICMTNCIIGCNTHLMVASSGFYQSHGPHPLGNACSNVPAHRRGYQNGQQSRCICSLLFVCLLHWWLTG